MKHLRCSQCRKAKPEEEFAPRPDTARGRRSECNGCKQRMNRTYYQDNRRRILARMTRKA